MIKNHQQTCGCFFAFGLGKRQDRISRVMETRKLARKGLRLRQELEPKKHLSADGIDEIKLFLQTR
jgi:hypothetical protein